MKAGILFRRHGLSNQLLFSHTLFPLLSWKKEIADFDIELIFGNKFSSKFYDCDVLWLIDYYRDSSSRIEENIKEIKHFKNYCKKIFYFDNTDSCGTTSFQYIEYIDRYIKKQLYKDKTLYLKEQYGSRLYCDFYHDHFNIINSFSENRQVVKNKKDIDKLTIGWNIGIGNYSPYCYPLNKINYLLALPLHKYFGGSYLSKLKNTHTLFSWDKKDIDIHARFSTSYSMETITFARNKALEFTEKTRKLNVKSKTKVNRRIFNEEVSKSKIVLSPFGYGEICFRDFIALQNSAVLFKPDMSHLDTWPQYYMPYVTYVPYKWDFSDFQKRIEYILSNSSSKLIAHNGHNYFYSSLSDQGRYEFCTRFAGLCNLK